MTDLPARRIQITTQLQWQDREWLAGIGFAPDGSAREVFADGVKSGQHMEALLDDACVLLSLLLQAGEPAASLADRLGQEGPSTPAIAGGCCAASPIGAIARKAAQIEAEFGAGIREAYAARAARVGE